MGLCHSFALKVYAHENELDLKVFLQSFDIKVSDLSQFRQIFNEIEKDNSGLAEIEKVLSSYADGVTNEDRLMFVRRLISVFDEEHTGYINFIDLILSIWNFCSVSVEYIGDFLFNLYDIDGDNLMSRDEMIIMIKEICGQSADSVLMNIMEFKNIQFFDMSAAKLIFDKYPDICLQVVDLQKSLKSKTGGESYWKKHSISRNKSHNSQRFCQLEEFMQNNLSSTCFEDSNRRRLEKLELVYRLTSSLSPENTITSCHSRSESPFDEVNRNRETQRILELNNQQSHQQNLHRRSRDMEVITSGSSQGNSYVMKHKHDNEPYKRKQQLRGGKNLRINNEIHSYDNFDQIDQFVHKTAYKRYMLSKETGLIYTN